MFVRLLPGSDQERRAVRDEIESHLSDRVHDLLVEGKTESQAFSLAIAELGDAAGVAANFRAIDRARLRRRLMNVGLIGFGGTTIVLSVAALTSSQQPNVPMVVFEPQKAEENREFSATPLTVDSNTTWGSFFQNAAKSGNLGLYVHWNQLGRLAGGGQVLPDSPVNLEIRNFTFDETLRLINENYNFGAEAGIDYRVQGGKLVVSTVEYFDKAETRLVTYDLSQVLDRMAQEQNNRMPVMFGQQVTMGQAPATREALMENVTHLISGLVHPEQWEDNGGDRAGIRSIGGKLFIEAPARLFPKIQWVLAQIEAGPQGAADAGPARDPLDRTGQRSSQLLPAWNLPADARPDSRVFQFANLEDTDARDALGELCNVSPGLRQCAVTRVMEIPAGEGNRRLMVSATSDQILTFAEFLAILDRPVPTSNLAPASTKTFPMSNVAADAAARVVNKAFDVSPYFAKAAQPRTLSIDSGTNSVLVSASSDQVEAIQRLLEIIDGAARPDDPASEPKRSLNPGGRPRTSTDPTQDPSRPLLSSMRSYPMARTDPSDARDVLSLAFNACPGLKQCAVDRIMAIDANTNTLVITATDDQLDVIETLLRFVDKPQVPAFARTPTTESIPLGSLAPGATLDLVNKLCTVAPDLQHSVVPRSIKLDDSQNALVITAGDDQIKKFRSFLSILTSVRPDPRISDAAAGR
jgi:hypothetical protein